MIEHPHTRRRVQDARSQIGIEILLFLYALLATIVLIRTVLVLLGISDRVWVGSFIYGLTAPLTKALAKMPGFTREILGPLTMVELILLGIVILFPLGLVATGGRHRR